MRIGKLTFRAHAIRRMFERRVSVEDVRATIENGEMIEDYPEDEPFPSRLVLAWVDGRPLHVVIAENAADAETIVITVYEPDPQQWESGFRTRKVRS